MEKSIFENVETKVKKILSEKLKISEENITLDALLKDDLGLDSFGSIEILFEIESTFNISINQEDIAKAVKVGDIIEYVKSRVAVSAPSP